MGMTVTRFRIAATAGADRVLTVGLAITLIFTVVAMSMTSMPVVKQVHQWAGEQQQIWQDAEQMGTVLGDQKKARHQNKSPKNPSTYIAVAIFMLRVLVHIISFANE